MKNLKPGAVQSIIGVVMGLAFAFFWTYMTLTAGAPIIFPIFGTGFILLMAVELYKVVQNARYDSFSEMEIMDEQQWQDYQQSMTPDYNSGNTGDIAFSGQLGDIAMYTDTEGTIYCPYCGVKILHDFEYCPKCGKKLPF